MIRHHDQGNLHMNETVYVWLAVSEDQSVTITKGSMVAGRQGAEAISERLYIVIHK